MTAIAFALSGAVCWAWWAIFGRVVIGPLTVWYLWYLAPFLVAGFYVLRSGDGRAMAGWVGLAAFWIAAQYLWSGKATYIERAFLHAIMMTYFAFIADRQSQLWISGIFMAAIGIDFMAYNGLFTQRGAGFIEPSYPDFLAGVSHAATIILASPFDGGGKRVRVPFGRPEWRLDRAASHVRLHRSGHQSSRESREG